MMKITLIGVIILLVWFRIMLPFIRERMLDKKELRDKPLNEKFSKTLYELDRIVFNGESTLTVYDENPEYLYMEGENNMNVSYCFMYSTGNLSVQNIFRVNGEQKIIDRQYNQLRQVDDDVQARLAKMILNDTKSAFAELMP